MGENDRNLSLDKDQNKAITVDKNPRLILMIVFFLLLSITVIDILFPHLIWRHFVIDNYPVHSTIEALGAIAAIIMAFMPLRILFGKYKPSYIFFSIGFFTMGMWDLIHSMLTVGHGFVFSHSMALFWGGFFFILPIFPWRKKVAKAKNPILIFVTSLTFLFLFLAYQDLEYIPNMLDMGRFTQSARVINFFAGFLFFVSVVHIFLVYIKEKSIGVLILLFVAALSAIAGITFPYSEAWTDSWWLWHILRLAAFLNVLTYLLWRIQLLNAENREAVKTINEKNKKLSESDERFRLVNEATLQGLWDWDLVNDKIYYSSIWKSQIGYKDDELENNFDTWVKLLHPDDKDRSIKYVNDFLKNPTEKFVLEFRFRHKDGHYVWIHNECSSVVDKNGKVLRMFGAHTDISEQKEAVIKLKESEEQFRIIFEESPIGKSKTGIDGSLQINRAFAEITGYEQEELQKINWKEITHPDDIQESEEVIKTLLSGKKTSMHFEKRYLHKDGHYIWTEVNTRIHRNDQDEPEYFITTITDITRSKQTLEALKHNEKKFSSLFQNDPSAILIADPETGLLVDVNPAAEDLMEMSREELIGMHQSQLHPQELQQEQTEKFKRLKAFPNESVESVIITKNGRKKQVEIKVSSVIIENKPHLLGIFHDVSKLMEKQKELKESEAKHRSIFESASDAFIIVNTKAEIVEVNPAACKIYGYSYNEMIGKKAMELIHPESRHHYKEFNESILQKGYYSGETIDMRKDGSTFYTEVHGATIVINNENHLLAVVRDVTAKKESEFKIRESERKFKTLFDSVSIPLCHVKKDGTIDAINNRFIDQLGYTKKDIPTLDEWWVKAYPDPKYRKWVINNWSMAVEESIRNNVDIQSDVYDVTTKRGEVRKMSIAGITFNNDTLATFIDLTQQIKAEDAIIREKEFTESIINTMPGIFYLFNKDGKFIKWNNTLAELAGISHEAVAEKTPIDFIAPYHKEKVIHAITTCFEEGEVLVEADFKAKGKNNIPFYFTGLRILMENQPLMLGVGLDISKRKEAEKAKEKALYDLNERIKEISCLLEVNELIRNTAIGIKDTMQLITLAIPRGWHYPDHTSVYIKINKNSYQNENYQESKIFLQESIFVDDRDVGHIKVCVSNLNDEQSKLPFLEEEKQLLRTIANNIGIYISRVEGEAKLKNTLEELKRSNKDLEQFAYVASHDLQEPLRMVSSYTQMLERKYKGKLDEKADKYIYYAVDGATRMQRLINDLLDFSRISTRGKAFEKVHTNKLVEQVLDSMKIKIKETNTRVTYDELPLIIADETQIERVFSNLLGNAIKFQSPDKSPEIHISAQLEGGKWHFTIKDNGIGIKPEFQDKIFIIFQRLHGVREYSGTGIGLAVCKQVIHRHKGKIWFESDGENGTTFHFTIKKDLKN